MPLCDSYYSAPDERVCVCVCVRVRVCVCVSAIISSEIHVRSSPIFVHATYGRGSVILRRRCSDTLCTSGFTDDVIFARKPRLLGVAAQLQRSAHAALGLAINCAHGHKCCDRPVCPSVCLSYTRAPNGAVYRDYGY